LNSSGLDRLLGQAMQALNQVRGADDGSPDAEPIQGFGEGADGMIQVTAETGGRLTGIELDPRVLRLTTVDLAQELVVAVNAALADLQARIQDAVAGPDLNSLAEQLKEVQEQSTRQMGTFLQALTDAQERIAAAGRR
jgi:DNA-binding protein YbaB